MKILVPVEDRLFAEVILHFLKGQSWPKGSEFKILHVITPLQDAFEWPSHCLEKRSEQLVQAVASRFRESLPDCNVESEVVHGVPAQVIQDQATAWPASIVAMGSHGRSGMAKKFIGSVSSLVAQKAPCPVIVLRPPLKGENGESKLVWLEDMTAAHKKYLEQHAGETPFPLDGSDWSRLVAMRLEDLDAEGNSDHHYHEDLLDQCHSLGSPLAHERAQLHDSHVHWFTIRGGKKREMVQEQENSGNHALRVLAQVSGNKTLKDFEKDWLKKRMKSWVGDREPGKQQPDSTLAIEQGVEDEGRRALPAITKSKDS